MKPAEFWIGIGCVFAFLAIALGAFGAHALSSRLEPKMMEIYQTGAHYHILHALALVAYGLWVGRSGSAAPGFTGWTFVAGILLFSGSLYALALSGIKTLGAITPIGGVAFMVAWLSWAVSCFRSLK